MGKKPKYVDTVVNSIHPLPLQITNALSNKHKNPRPQVDFFATNLSTYSSEYQYVVSDEISYSYDRTTPYPMDSVFFKKMNQLWVSIMFTDFFIYKN